MATAQKGKLYRMRNEVRMHRGVRMVKMVAAICPDRYTLDSHQPDGESTGFWIEACKAAGHDPYISAKEVERKVPVYETREDGKKYKVSEDILIELVETPNFEQVYGEIKGVSGRLIEAALEQGWVWPDELGYAPFCEYLNCWNQNPKFRTNVGVYCNREQAALMVLVTGGDIKSDKGTPTYLTFGEDEENFKRQLRNVGDIEVEK